MRHLRSALLALVATAGLAGCGGGHAKPVVHRPAAPKTVGQPAGCDPLKLARGVMGACTPQARPGASIPNLRGATLIPDVSEFQGCGLRSPAIWRAYEAGTDRQDTNARCHAEEVHRHHDWNAAYAFLRPSRSCAYEAGRTLAIVASVGGTDVVIADAEVPLPAGFVSCFNRIVAAHGYPAITYTAPGTWPGGPFNTRVWVAAYPNRPACFSNSCPYVAHQFSDAWNCRGVFGDCSIDEGITAIHRRPAEAPAEHRAKLLRELAGHRAVLHGLRLQIAHIRGNLRSHGCSTLRHAHRPLGRYCTVEFASGDAAHRRGRAEDAAIYKLLHELHLKGRP